MSETDAFRFGDGDRLFGVLTLPDELDMRRPVFVHLSGGLLHRVGPRRLYVRLARELASAGFASFRVDLSGRGDSAVVPGRTYQEALRADWGAVMDELVSRVRASRIICGGLCSAADDAIRVGLEDFRVVGMILLDPVCDRDAGYNVREATHRLLNPARYQRWVRAKLGGVSVRRAPSPSDAVDPLSLRHAPSMDETRNTFEAIRDRGGSVFTLFTSYATAYLNEEGQMGRMLAIQGYERFARECYWPAAEHSFTLEVHRRRLIEEIIEWSDRFRDGAPSIG